MRKSLVVMAMALLPLFAHAQFEKGKMYAGASLTGLSLSYNGWEKFKVGLDAKAGYLAWDNIMLLGLVSYQHTGVEGSADHVALGVGGRYYIVQNGLYVGVNAKYVHDFHNYNDFMPGVEVGYSFFLNGKVTIEPAIYYDQSVNRHSDFSTIGLRVGFGVYL